MTIRGLSARAVKRLSVVYGRGEDIRVGRHGYAIDNGPTSVS